MLRRDFLRKTSVTGLAAMLGARIAKADNTPRPNILILLADDWGWPSSPLYGERGFKTPALEQIARDGVLFHHAYCSAPTCTASRGAILTGQDFWRLKEGANLLGSLPASLAVYPDLLEAEGYVIGSRSKGWSPGNPYAGGRTRNPAGPSVTGKGDFKGFLEKLPPEKPFCFWFGSTYPHRDYVKGSGIEAGLNPDDVHVPGFLPDAPEVRSDLCDYRLMVQKFNDDAMHALQLLQKSGRYDNTLIIIAGDNGMPFPRCKMHVYEWGVHQPLAMCWKARIPGGRTVDDYTCFTDFAPTVLEAANVPIPADMTGRSLLPLLLSGKTGQVESDRDAVFVGRERHGEAYPMRAIRTKDFAYIRNFAPERDAGQSDKGPTRDYILAHKDEPAMRTYYQACFGPRPAEELYDLRADPFEMRNLAQDATHADIKHKLAGRLMTYLKVTGDPRALGHGEVFEQYKTWNKRELRDAFKQHGDGG